MDMLTLLTIVLPFLTLFMIALMTNNIYGTAVKEGKKNEDKVMYIGKEMPLRTLKIYAVFYNILSVVIILLVVAAVATKLLRNGHL